MAHPFQEVRNLGFFFPKSGKAWNLRLSFFLQRNFLIGGVTQVLRGMVCATIAAIHMIFCHPHVWIGVFLCPDHSIASLQKTTGVSKLC